MGQVFFKMLVGAVAGTLAWVICEPQMPANVYDEAGWQRASLLLVLLIGGLVGIALGGVNGYLQGSRVHTLKGLGFGLLGGLLGASLGNGIGGAFLRLFPGDLSTATDKYPIFYIMMGRLMFMAPLGLCIGLGIGLVGWTKRRILVGALGGFAGGVLAGLLFDPVSFTLGSIVVAMKQSQPGAGGVVEVGIFGRALLGILVGGGIGLFMGVFDRATRTAWLRLTLGRNEGKEWVVDAPQTFIGRSESAHVPLFGDNSIAPMHACIARQGPNYILMDGGSPVGTYLNGQPVKQMPLFHGAVIRIGTFDLQFMMRTGQAPVYGPEVLRSMSQYPVQPQVAPPVGAQTMVATMAPPPGMVTQAVPSIAHASTLVALAGQLAGQRFTVHGPLEIGREGTGIALASDASASRRHAAVSPGPAGLQLTDLGSTNGTFVNEQRVQNAVLRPGDVVRIGTTTFRVE